MDRTCRIRIAGKMELRLDLLWIKEFHLVEVGETRCRNLLDGDEQSTVADGADNRESLLLPSAVFIGDPLKGAVVAFETERSLELSLGQAVGRGLERIKNGIKCTEILIDIRFVVDEGNLAQDGAIPDIIIEDQAGDPLQSAIFHAIDDVRLTVVDIGPLNRYVTKILHDSLGKTLGHAWAGERKIDMVKPVRTDHLAAGIVDPEQDLLGIRFLSSSEEPALWQRHSRIGGNEHVRIGIVAR